MPLEEAKSHLGSAGILGKEFIILDLKEIRHSLK
jgi:hypothetical protein